MKVYTEGIRDFKPWSGAVTTWNNVREERKLDDLEFLLEELYPEGMSETMLNDILWFEDMWIYEQLDIDTEEEEE